MRVIYLSKRWEHHTPSGGYDRMAEETGAEVVRRSMLRGLARRIACKLWRRISESKPFLLDYRCEDWLAEWQTIVRARLRRHPLYMLSGAMNSWTCSCGIVGSFRVLLS